MNTNTLRYVVDIGLLFCIIVSVVTGLFKFTLIMRALGLTNLVLPLAQMSDIHDWSGLTLAILVAVHLFLNRGWLATMTRKILSGTKSDP